MKRVKRTYLDVLDYVESFNHILLSNKQEIVNEKGYVQAKTKLHIECDKGHRFHTCFDVYKKGKFKCRRCALESGNSRRKYTFEDIVTLFGKEEYEILSPKEEYRNVETVLKTRCPKGHAWTSSYSNFKSGYRCPKCNVEDKESQSLKKDRKVLIDNGYEVMGFEKCKGRFFTDSCFTVKCRKGHITKKTIRSIRSGKLSCVECMKNKKKTLKEIDEIFRTYGYNIVLHNGYENNQSRFLISCKNGHRFDTTYASFQQRDKRCCFCDEGIIGISKGEKKISSFLDENNIEYIYQYKIDGCKLKSSLPFDFYLPNYNVLIEFDGEQHYKIVSHFGGLDKFISQKIADTIKNEYCKKNNITLIRIPYWEFDNIEDILNYRIYEKSSTTIPTGSTL